MEPASAAAEGASRDAAPGVPYASPGPVDPDFTAEVVDDLYRYPHKRAAVGWLLWLLLGLVGGHRFYLSRPGSAILMLFTGGGFLLWWALDAFLLPRMVRRFNAEQDRREREGRPPVGLDFMPPRDAEALRLFGTRPAWALDRAPSGARGWMWLAGDVTVLLLAGLCLGAVSGATGSYRAGVAIGCLIAVTLLGTRRPELWRLPVLRDLVRWSHKLRLFYHVNAPGSPPALLVRSLTGAVLAPFRRRQRAEARLYLQLGGAVTAAFLAVDVVTDLALPLVATGSADLAIERWAESSALTMVNVYAFAAPIGGVLTLWLLARRSHRTARLLSVVALGAMALGIAAGLGEGG